MYELRSEERTSAAPGLISFRSVGAERNVHVRVFDAVFSVLDHLLSEEAQRDSDVFDLVVVDLWGEARVPLSTGQSSRSAVSSPSPVKALICMPLSGCFWKFFWRSSIMMTLERSLPSRLRSLIQVLSLLTEMWWR